MGQVSSRVDDVMVFLYEWTKQRKRRHHHRRTRGPSTGADAMGGSQDHDTSDDSDRPDPITGEEEKFIESSGIQSN